MRLLLFDLPPLLVRCVDNKEKISPSLSSSSLRIIIILGPSLPQSPSCPI